MPSWAGCATGTGEVLVKSCSVRAHCRVNLLQGLLVNRLSQVWCTLIPYTPMRRGFLHLTAIMD